MFILFLRIIPKSVKLAERANRRDFERMSRSLERSLPRSRSHSPGTSAGFIHIDAPHEYSTHANHSETPTQNSGHNHHAVAPGSAHERPSWDILKSAELLEMHSAGMHHSRERSDSMLSVSSDRASSHRGGGGATTTGCYAACLRTRLPCTLPFDLIERLALRSLMARSTNRSLRHRSPIRSLLGVGTFVSRFELFIFIF